MASVEPGVQKPARVWITRAFSIVEDLVYVGLGLLLAGCAIALLITALASFGESLFAGKLPNAVIDLIDRILLILLVVELLYTVQVSFREHAVTPEPFLLVGVIAGIRRVLVLTVEFGHASEKTDVAVQHFVMELLALTVLVIALVVSLFVLRKRENVKVAQAPDRDARAG